MSSIDDYTATPQEMPPGFHYARIMANIATLPDEQRHAIAESAWMLIAEIPVDDDAVQELRSVAERFAQIVRENPAMTEAHPGGSYWPIWMLVGTMRDAGIEVTIPSFKVTR
jgi:hypothetical protein